MENSEKKADIKWTREELLLALDVYQKSDRSKDIQNAEVDALSAELRALTIHPAEGRRDNFRSPDGTRQLLKRFAQLDGGSEIRGSASKDMKRMQELYGKNPQAVSVMAQAVREAFKAE